MGLADFINGVGPAVRRAATDYWQPPPAGIPTRVAPPPDPNFPKEVTVKGLPPEQPKEAKPDWLDEREREQYTKLLTDRYKMSPEDAKKYAQNLWEANRNGIAPEYEDIAGLGELHAKLTTDRQKLTEYRQKRDEELNRPHLMAAQLAMKNVELQTRKQFEAAWGIGAVPTGGAPSWQTPTDPAMDQAMLADQAQALFRR